MTRRDAATATRASRFAWRVGEATVLQPQVGGGETLADLNDLFPVGVTEDEDEDGRPLPSVTEDVG